MAQSKLSGSWETYLQLLETAPIKTKAITAAVLSVVSDLLAQRLTGARAIDWKSVSNQMLVGLTVRGPPIHYWFMVLDGMFSSWNPDSLSTAFMKVLVDQLFFSPLFNLLYFYVIGFLENKSIKEIRRDIATSYKTVMINNYKIWPLLNMLNFSVVPPKLRVLFGNVMSIFWTAYMISLTKGAKKAKSQ